MIGIDAEGSTRLTDPAKGYLRETMYALFEQSLYAGGLTAPYRDAFLDRGDGVLALVHPVDQAPKTRLLDTVVPTLGALLAEHNRRHPVRRFRLRTVVHAGEVTFDDNGCFGEALDVAFRLLNANPVKRILSGTDAPMVLVVSDEMHRSVVRHGYDGIDPKAFSRLLLPRTLVRSAWVRVIDASQGLPRRPGDPVTRIEDYRRRA
jgi:class 3 adenylate cyclase